MEVQAPATGDAALDDGRTVGATLGNLDLGGDRVGLVPERQLLVADLPARFDAVRPMHDGCVGAPPQWEATCLVHWNGVFVACAQPTA